MPRFVVLSGAERTDAETLDQAMAEAGRRAAAGASVEVMQRVALLTPDDQVPAEVRHKCARKDVTGMIRDALTNGPDTLVGLTTRLLQEAPRGWASRKSAYNAVRQAVVRRPEHFAVDADGLVRQLFA